MFIIFGWLYLSRVSYDSIELMDQVDDLMTSKAVPFRFRVFEQWDGENWRLKKNAFLGKSDRIRNASI